MMGENKEPYLVATRVIDDHRGLIAWRWGTGGNTEITHLKASADGQGYGQKLLRSMLVALRADPPYCTVFGFSRPCNTGAHEFYRKVGFTLSRVAGVYADGEAIVFSANFRALCRIHLNEEVEDGCQRLRPGV